MLDGVVEVKSLVDVGLSGDIPETSDTLQGNALQKAQWVWERVGMDCFADDTGLEVDALGGAPGVYSARYAGEHCSFDDNIDKLLAALDGKTNRKADFRTVICLMEQGVPRYFEGKVDGVILTERYGSEGFGYDPVFMPDRFAVSFAEMPLDVKNTLSPLTIVLPLRLTTCTLSPRRRTWQPFQSSCHSYVHSSSSGTLF